MTNADLLLESGWSLVLLPYACAGHPLHRRGMRGSRTVRNNAGLVLGRAAIGRAKTTSSVVVSKLRDDTCNE